MADKDPVLKIPDEGVWACYFVIPLVFLGAAVVNIVDEVELTWQLVVVLSLACSPAFLIILKQHVQKLDIKGVGLVLQGYIDPGNKDVEGFVDDEDAEDDGFPPPSSLPIPGPSSPSGHLPPPDPVPPPSPAPTGDPAIRPPPIKDNPLNLPFPNASVSTVPFDSLSPTSQRVLRTLWKFQRVHFGLAFSPKRWGFIVGPGASDYARFLLGATELKIWGLIFKDKNDMVYLSDDGFLYCQHYSEMIDKSEDYWGKFDNDKPAAE